MPEDGVFYRVSIVAVCVCHHFLLNKGAKKEFILDHNVLLDADGSGDDSTEVQTDGSSHEARLQLLDEKIKKSHGYAVPKTNKGGNDSAKATKAKMKLMKSSLAAHALAENERDEDQHTCDDMLSDSDRPSASNVRQKRQTSSSSSSKKKSRSGEQSPKKQTGQQEPSSSSSKKKSGIGEQSPKKQTGQQEPSFGLQEHELLSKLGVTPSKTMPEVDFTVASPNVKSVSRSGRSKSAHPSLRPGEWPTSKPSQSPGAPRRCSAEAGSARRVLAYRVHHSHGSQTQSPEHAANDSDDQGKEVKEQDGIDREHASSISVPDDMNFDEPFDEDSTESPKKSTAKKVQTKKEQGSASEDSDDEIMTDDDNLSDSESESELDDTAQRGHITEVTIVDTDGGEDEATDNEIVGKSVQNGTKTTSHLPTFTAVSEEDVSEEEDVADDDVLEFAKSEDLKEHYTSIMALLKKVADETDQKEVRLLALQYY